MYSNIHYYCSYIISLSDELGRVRLRPGPQPGSDYINASFVDVCLHCMASKSVGEEEGEPSGVAGGREAREA